MSHWSQYGTHADWVRAGKPAPAVRLGDLDFSPQAVAGLKHMLGKLGQGAEPRHFRAAATTQGKPDTLRADIEELKQAAPSKPYGSMSNAERVALKQSSPETFAKIRSAWLRENGYDDDERVIRAGSRVIRHDGREQSPARAEPVQHAGKAFEHIRPIDRAALKDSNPALYDRLREDWVARGEPIAD